MTPFAQLSLLTRCALGTSPDPAREIAAAGLDADALIALSLHQKIAPFLRGLTTDPVTSPVLPAVLRDALVQVYKANRMRNHRLRHQIGELLGLLNAVGVVPVLLKGGARLVDGAYPDWGYRFMYDLDMLVAEDQIDLAQSTLLAGGYGTMEREGNYPDEYHHLPTLIRDGAPASVELHRAVVEHWRHDLLPPAALIARSREIDVGGNKARVPDISDSLVHLVAHGQLQHERLLSGEISLPDAVEFVLLVRQGGPAALQQAFDRTVTRSERLAFALSVSLCEQITGERLPIETGRSGLAQFLARRALWQQDRTYAQTAGRMLAFLRSATAFRRYPSLLRRFPGRLAEPAFYRNRWRDLQRRISGNP